jgi:hypothetical protein
MAVIEWVILIWFGLDILAGLYYYSQDGYKTDPAVYWLSVLTSAGFGVWLVTLSGLTWVGWLLLVLFCYSLGISLWRIVSGTGSRQKTRGDIAVSMLVSVVVVGLTLTVGLVV